MNSLKILNRYLSFWFQSGNAHSIHSPFVFNLYTQVIRSRQHYPVFGQIEAIRLPLLRSKQTLAVVDFGAGSRLDGKVSQREIRNIARHAEKNSHLGQLLFRLANHFQPTNVLDLGTSLGITTLYLAAATQQATVFTFEGCPQTLEVAQKNFARMGYRHIQPVEGNIDVTLPETLQRIKQIDFAFFDANHRFEPTLRYFKTCLSKVHENTVLVFDDIYWSAEMTEAWEQIKEHEAVTLTIDLFEVGLVFFRSKQPKQHFKLRF